MKMRNYSCPLILFALLLTFFVLGAAHNSASAQSSVSDLGIRGPVGQVDPDAMVDGVGAKKYYKTCSQHLPVGFTPSTRDDFCTCASVTVTQVLTNAELASVMDVKKSGDKFHDMSLIKYVDAVVAPCLEAPVRTLGYISCLEERAHDHRIRSFPAYCSCVGDVAERMLRNRGARDIITHYTSRERNAELRPVESFIRSPLYRNYVMTGMQACIQPAYMEWR